MKKTILVTGGAGFIGGNFILGKLTEGDCRVVNLDALTYAGNRETLAPVEDSPDYFFVEGSIADRNLVGKILEEYSPQAIVNFAAESHVDRSIDAPDDFIQTNIVGTFELLEAVRQYWGALPENDKKAFRFLHVSTDEVYGSLGQTGLFTESSPYQPNSPYSASKAASDHLVRANFHTYGLPVLTTNCSNNYGPYQFPEKLIPLMILNALEGKSLPVYGDGSNVRDWLYVEDHCRAISCVLEKGIPGEVYNVGGNSEQKNIDVVTILCNLLDELLPDSDNYPHGDLVTFVKDRPGHDQRYAIDASKISSELGWAPQETFETGLKRTVEWYLSNFSWVERVQDGSYRGERLGLGDQK